jgi:succinate dehydrogenase / fumarate reductase flavoprotein subunit
LNSGWSAGEKPGALPADHPEFKRCEAEVTERLKKLLAIKGKKTAVEYHREVGKILWDNVGMSRTRESCERAVEQVRELRAEFWQNVNVPGSADDLNTALERANRVADFMEFGELLALDALTREESCGGHFREEYQYEDGEAKRDDEHHSHVAAWEFQGPDRQPTRHREELIWETVKPSVRSYK